MGLLLVYPGIRIALTFFCSAGACSQSILYIGSVLFRLDHQFPNWPTGDPGVALIQVWHGGCSKAFHCTSFVLNWSLHKLRPGSFFCCTPIFQGKQLPVTGFCKDWAWWQEDACIVEHYIATVNVGILLPTWIMAWIKTDAHPSGGQGIHLGIL